MYFFLPLAPSSIDSVSSPRPTFARQRAQTVSTRKPKISVLLSFGLGSSVTRLSEAFNSLLRLGYKWELG